MPKVKVNINQNETWHKLLYLKGIPDARFEFGNSSSFGAMRSKISLRSKRRSDQIWLFTPRKVSCYVKNLSI